MKMNFESSFPTVIHNTLNLEGGARELRRFRLYRCVDAHGGERPADNTAGEVEELVRKVSEGIGKKRIGKRTGCARTTAWPPASVLMRANGRKEWSVRT
jgi:hypothetical protein